MTVFITKIQILPAQSSGNPLFYCHSSDVGHSPTLQAAALANGVRLDTGVVMFKVKRNPQSKNRVDIYMPVPAAHQLGHEIAALTVGTNAWQWPPSNANPHAAVAAGSAMALPNIQQAYYGFGREAGSETSSGLRMSVREPRIFIDVETPHTTHIKMNTREVHIALNFSPPTANDDGSGSLVDVPEHELQRRTHEQNPIRKVQGRFYVDLDAGKAAGLAALLVKL